MFLEHQISILELFMKDKLNWFFLVQNSLYQTRNVILRKHQSTNNCLTSIRTFYMFLITYNWTYSSIPVMIVCCTLLGWWLLFSTLMGGTTTVLTAGLFSTVLGCPRLAWGSWFWFWLVRKRLSGKGLSWGPREESEGGEPSTVSHPLSWSSSSDILW